MKLRLLIICFLLVAAGMVNAQIPTWVATGQGILEDEVSDIEVDKWGNIYAVGYYYQDTHLGGVTLSDSMAGSFISKFNPDGTLVWSKQIYNDGLFQRPVIAAGPEGQIVIAVEVNFCCDTIYVLDSFPVPISIPGLGHSMIVLELDTSGAPIWSYSASFYDIGQPKDIATDSKGNVFVCGLMSSSIYADGAFHGTFDFQDNAFLIRLTDSGSFSWIKPFTSSVLSLSGPSDMFPDRMAVQSNGNLVYAGYTSDSLYMGDTIVVGSPGSNNGYLASWDSSGNFLWMQCNNAAAGSVALHDVAVDSSDNIYASAHGWTPKFGWNSLPAYSLMGTDQIWKFDPTGNLMFSRRYESNSAEIEHLICNSVGEIFVAGLVQDSADFDGLDIPYLSCTAQAFWAKISPTGFAEKIEWVSVPGFCWGTSYSGESRILGIASNASNELFFCGKFDSTFSFGPVNVTAADYVDGFVFHPSETNNFICGKVFYDDNANGIRDLGEDNAAGLMMESTTPTVSCITYSEGQYQLRVDSGTFSVSLASPPPYYTLTPASQISSFSGWGLSDTLIDFALSPVPGIQDARVSLIQTSSFRPGFDATLALVCSNPGTDSIAPNVVLDYSPFTDYVTASIPPAASGSTWASWTLPSMGPRESITWLVTLHTDSLLPIGSLLRFYASVNPVLGDALPSDNYDTLEVTVVGSYDPNAKLSNPSGVVPSTYLDAGGWIEYTVMFQNTGTDTAFTVAVRDTLDSQLDISTFEFVGSSHPCTWRLAGTRLMEFFFPGILLPDSNVNEPASHGVFQFRIKTLPGVPVGAVIANTAHIYFDYNAPVATNTAFLFVDTLLLTSQPPSPYPLVKVWPNPAGEILFIELPPGYSYAHEAQLFNLQGQLVRKMSIEEGINSFSLEHLPGGVYLLRTNVPECQNFRITRLAED